MPNFLLHDLSVTKAKQVQAKLQKLSPAKLRQVRDRLEDFLEDQLKFTKEFAAATKPSRAKTKSSAPLRKDSSKTNRRKIGRQA